MLCRSVLKALCGKVPLEFYKNGHWRPLPYYQYEDYLMCFNNTEPELTSRVISISTMICPI